MAGLVRLVPAIHAAIGASARMITYDQRFRLGRPCSRGWPGQARPRRPELATHINEPIGIAIRAKCRALIVLGHGERGIGEGPAAAKRRRHGRAVRPATWFGGTNDQKRGTRPGKPLLLVAAMSASSVRRRSVDGRDNPRIKSGDGRDGTRSRPELSQRLG